MKRCASASCLEINYLASTTSSTGDLVIPRLEAIFQFLDVPFFILDKSMRIVCCVEPSFFCAFMSAETCVGRKIDEVSFPEQVSEVVLQNIALTEATGIPHQAECLFRFLNEEKCFQIKICPIVENCVNEGFVIVCKDITEKKELERAYKEQKRLLSLIENNITDIVAIYNPDATLQYVSTSAKHILGCDPALAIGTDPFEKIHPEDVSFAKAGFSFHDFPNDKTITNEYRLRHKDGNWLHFDARKRAVWNDEKELVCVVATSRDVTAKKEIETALRKSEEHYRMLADNVMDMITLHKPNGEIVYASPSTFQTLGYSLQELQHMNFEDFIHPEDFSRLRNEYYANNFDGKDKLDVEYRVRNKQKQWFYLSSHVTVIRNEANEVVKLLAASRDITDKKMTEIALRESEEKYESLTESSSSVISLVKEDGEILYANKLAIKYINRLGYDYKEGLNISGVILGKNGRYLKAKIRRSVKRNNTDSFKTFFWLQNERFWLKVVIQPVLDSTGRPYAVMLNVFDLTDAKYNEEVLEMQNEQLKSIAFMQSHIVRAPLTNIMALLDLIEKDELGKDNFFYVEMLQKVAGDMDDFIKEIVRKATKDVAALVRGRVV